VPDADIEGILGREITTSCHAIAIGT